MTFTQYSQHYSPYQTALHHTKESILWSEIKQNSGKYFQTYITMANGLWGITLMIQWRNIGFLIKQGQNMHNPKLYRNYGCFILPAVLFIFYVIGLPVVRIKWNNRCKRPTKELILISFPNYQQIIFFGEKNINGSLISLPGCLQDLFPTS